MPPRAKLPRASFQRDRRKGRPTKWRKPTVARSPQPQARRLRPSPLGQFMLRAMKKTRSLPNSPAHAAVILKLKPAAAKQEFRQIAQAQCKRLPYNKQKTVDRLVQGMMKEFNDYRHPTQASRSGGFNVVEGGPWPFKISRPKRPRQR